MSSTHSTDDEPGPDGRQHGTLSLPDGRLVEGRDETLVPVWGMDWSQGVSYADETIVYGSSREWAGQ